MKKPTENKEARPAETKDEQEPAEPKPEPVTTAQAGVAAVDSNV